MNTKSLIQVISAMTLGLLVVTTQSFAQDAKSVLQKSSDFFDQADNIYIDFSVKTHYEVTDETNVSDGDLLLGDGDEFRLRVPGLEYYSDGVNLWQVNTASKQVLAKSLLDLDGGLHPSELLFRYLRCKPLAVKKDQLDGQEVYVLQLDPTGEIKIATKMEVWLDAKNFSPLRLKTIDVSKNTSWYTIKDLKTNIQVKHEDFVYKAPKGVEVIDMR